MQNESLLQRNRIWLEKIVRYTKTRYRHIKNIGYYKKILSFEDLLHDSVIKFWNNNSEESELDYVEYKKKFIYTFHEMRKDAFSPNNRKAKNDLFGRMSSYDGVIDRLSGSGTIGNSVDDYIGAMGQSTQPDAYNFDINDKLVDSKYVKLKMEGFTFIEIGKGEGVSNTMIRKRYLKEIEILKERIYE